MRRHCLTAFLLLLLTAEGKALDFTYTNTNGTITITGYTGPGGNVTIPSTIAGLPVIDIGAEAFASCGSLTNVIIGNGLLTIGPLAFGNCTNLTTLAIPASTLNIDASAFGGVPASDGETLGGCIRLDAVKVDPLNKAYSSLEGVLFNEDQSELLFYPEGKIGNYVIPNSVIVIGPSAFESCSNLTGITIGTNVAFISNWAFLGCSGLTRLTLPDTITNIQDAPLGGFGNGVDGGVFYGCTSLTNITVGKGLSYLGLGALGYCTNLLGVYFTGNAPALSTLFVTVDVFGADSPTVYYLPGTTGWGSSFAGRPAILWNPLAQTNDASFGVRQNRFGFNITGTPDIPIVVEATTNLATRSWVSLQGCTLTNGLIYFSDPQPTYYPGRFYRIRSP
jgi:hypothetical protein